MSENVVDEIIKDLNRIPKTINTDINIKELANEVSKILQRQTTGRFSQ